MFIEFEQLRKRQVDVLMRLGYDPIVEEKDLNTWVPAILFAVDSLDLMRSPETDLPKDNALEYMRSFFQHYKRLPSYYWIEEDELGIFLDWVTDFMEAMVNTNFDHTVKLGGNYNNYYLDSPDCMLKTPLGSRQMAMFFGTLLNEGIIEITKYGKIFSLSHPLARKKYVKNVYRYLINWCKFAPFEVKKQMHDKKAFEIFYVCRTHPFLNLEEVDDLFYDYSTGQREKKMPTNESLAKFFTSEALAYLFMDSNDQLDESKPLKLNVKDFKKTEVQRFIGFLKDRFNFNCEIETKIEQNSDSLNWQIKIDNESNNKKRFLSLIARFFGDSFKLK